MTDDPHVSTHDAAEDARNDDILIYVDGELMHRDAASVSVYDSGFMLGDGVWEGLRVYPGPDGVFATPDEHRRNGEMHVPVNQVVHVKLKAEDVIHSFFLPHLRLQQDAMPGHTITVWFEATEPGVYPIPCAELCGSGHTGMLGQLTVHTAEAYDAWVKQQWPTS